MFSKNYKGLEEIRSNGVYQPRWMILRKLLLCLFLIGCFLLNGKDNHLLGKIPFLEIQALYWKHVSFLMFYLDKILSVFGETLNWILSGSASQILKIWAWILFFFIVLMYIFKLYLLIHWKSEVTDMQRNKLVKLWPLIKILINFPQNT